MSYVDIFIIAVVFAALLSPVVLLLRRIRRGIVGLAQMVGVPVPPGPDGLEELINRGLIDPDDQERSWNPHPTPDPSDTVYGTEGPYDGCGSPPSDISTSYFYRLLARGFNAMEAALVARGLGPIIFGDDYPPGRMLEIGLDWTKERGFRDGSTWESRLWRGVRVRYAELYNGNVVQEAVAAGEQQSPTDRERTQWVHEAMRLLYPAWALEGVIPPMRAESSPGSHGHGG